MRVVEHWNRLPREAVESPSVKIFKIQQDMVLSNLVQSILLELPRSSIL